MTCSKQNLSSQMKKHFSFKSSPAAEMSSDVKIKDTDTTDESLEEQSSEFREEKK
jgi:hypothetical protein